MKGCYAMGYYDEGYQRPTRPKKQKGIWFTSFVSSIIGGLTVMIMLPAIASIGILPYDVVLKNPNVMQEEAVSEVSTVHAPVQQQTVQLNVSSEIVDAVEKVSNAIVGVVNIQETSDIFSRQPAQNVERGTGSGVIFEIIGDKAHIVTNYHVIQNAKKVEISLSNGERVQAQLKGIDPLTDLAVLEIDAKYVDTVASFGDSDAVRPGEPAIAIGNPLGLEFSRTVTQGIISAKERSVPVSANWELNVIQTDAAINPGNSGGALINIRGQVIGINSLKINQQGVEGIGFAIPINDALPIIHDLIRFGEVQRPYMGIGPYDLTSVASYHLQETFKLPEHVKHGVIISEVEKLSPADVAGLQKYDIIVEIDGVEISNSTALRKYIFNKKSIGDTIEVSYYRGGMLEKAKLELSKVLKSN
jgi:serine protease Do